VTGSFRWTAIKLAIFTIVTVVVTLWLASVIGNFRLLAKPYEITAEFTDATGLLRGDVVKAAGVTIGRVERIEIRNGMAVVTMSIEEDVDLPADLEAEVRFRNLIGQRMVVLQPKDGSDGGLTEPGDTIALEDTESAFDLSALFNGLRPVIRSTSPEDINTVTRALTQALEGRSKDVEAFLGNVADLSRTIAAKDQSLSALLDNLNIVTSDLAGRDSQLQATLADIESFLADVAASRDDLNQAVVSLDDAARRLERVVERNDDDIEAEIRDLSTLLDAVGDKRADLRAAVRALPEMLVGVERTSNYGEWSMVHLIHVCKDDFGTCGTRGTP
jgi:phospholipid/cholesterol/gamma-HCH transport system substrate-binding protein